MPAAAVVGAATVVAGVYQGIQSNKTARRGQDMQRDALNQNLAFQQQMYEDEKAFRDPIRNMLKDLAMSPGSLDYDINKAQLEGNVSDARRGIEEQIAASGMEGTGLGASRRMGLTLARAKGLSQLYAQGIKSKRELAASLLGAANPQAAAAGVAGARRDIAGMGAGIAAQGAASSAAGWGAAAQGLGSILSAYQQQGTQASPYSGLSEVTSTIPTGQTYDMNTMLQQPGVVQNGTTSTDITPLIGTNW